MRRLRSARQNTAKTEKEREGKLATVIVIVVCLIYASLLLRALHVLRQHVRTVSPPPSSLVRIRCELLHLCQRASQPSQADALI